MELLPPSTITQLLPTLQELAPAAPPPRHPTLLVLGPHTHNLPWESCSGFRTQPISRIPSLSFALAVKRARSVPVKLEREETFYILNPTQNLPSTQVHTVRRHFTFK